MASLTVRNIDDTIKERLRVRAAMHGHSMEEETRVILEAAVGGMTGSALWQLSRELFSADNGADLALPQRGNDRPVPNFDDPEYDREP
jgi:antitoxin FitA